MLLYIYTYPDFWNTFYLVYHRIAAAVIYNEMTETQSVTNILNTESRSVRHHHTTVITDSDRRRYSVHIIERGKPHSQFLCHAVNIIKLEFCPVLLCCNFKVKNQVDII